MFFSYFFWGWVGVEIEDNANSAKDEVEVDSEPGKKYPKYSLCSKKSDAVEILTLFLYK